MVLDKQKIIKRYTPIIFQLIIQMFRNLTITQIQIIPRNPKKPLLISQDKNQMTNFKQDWSFTKYHQKCKEREQVIYSIQNVHEKVLKYVEQNAEKGNLKSCIDAIDKFCQQCWMMNLGSEKCMILKNIFEKRQSVKILQLGGYCGYSSLVFSYLTKAQIHTIQIDEGYANIAQQMHELAGVKERNHISIGTVSTLQNQITQRGSYDVILLDHAKDLYMSDFQLLEQYGVIGKGTLIIGDNIIYPGVKGYMQMLKDRQDYCSTLYHTYLQCWNIPDAVLISQRLKD